MVSTTTIIDTPTASQEIITSKVIADHAAPGMPGGSEEDPKNIYTLSTASVAKALVTLAVPMALGTAITAIYSIINSYFIGHFGTVDMLAAINYANPTLTIMMAVGGEALLDRGDQMMTAMLISVLFNGLTMLFMVWFQAAGKASPAMIMASVQGVLFIPRPSADEHVVGFYRPDLGADRHRIPHFCPGRCAVLRDRRNESFPLA